MDDEQLDFFTHDEDDPPPTESYSDLHWWFLNRWAELSMRYARFFGII